VRAEQFEGPIDEVKPRHRIAGARSIDSRISKIFTNGAPAGW
jgi:hypothetical protein